MNLGEAPILTGLYVPGDRPDRFEKAVGSGAHLVVFDLEDAVAPDRKRFAREAVAEWLARPREDAAPVIQVRVNHGDADDLAMLAGLAADIEVRMPKVETAGDVDAAVAVAGERPITALVETAAGVLSIREIAAHPAVTRIGLGESDLRSAVGSGDDVVDFARMQLVFAASAAAIEPPMLAVYPAIDDVAGLASDTRRGAAQGFIGRMAVHPRQLPVILTAFRPDPGEVERAHEVVRLLREGGVHRAADGAMVDPAMAMRAHRTLALAQRVDASLDRS